MSLYLSVLELLLYILFHGPVNYNQASPAKSTSVTLYLYLYLYGRTSPLGAKYFDTHVIHTTLKYRSLTPLASHHHIVKIQASRLYLRPESNLIRSVWLCLKSISAGNFCTTDRTRNICLLVSIRTKRVHHNAQPWSIQIIHHLFEPHFRYLASQPHHTSTSSLLSQTIRAHNPNQLYSGR